MRKRNMIWAGLILFGSSCVQILDGGHDYTDKEDVPAIPCNEDANCQDKDSDPCTLNICGANKVCEFPIIPGIAPEQLVGDCRRTVCTEAGDKTEEVDDEDLPDDLESCTLDSCANGAAVHASLPDDTACILGELAGLCKSGKCTVECGPGFPPCNDGNPCSEDTCNANKGECSFAPLDGLPTPDFMPIAGDCQQAICIGGTSTSIADDADLPNDDNTCTKDTCSNGTPIHTPNSPGAPCLNGGIPGFCDEVGQCVQCNVAEDCPDTGNPCKQRTCVNNVCGVMDMAGEVPSKDGDCKKTVCVMAGPQEQVDTTDVPVDGNPCTKDICTGATPSNPAEAMGASCGGTLTCNGMGQCTGCTTAADCGASDACKTYTCSNSQCSIKYELAGTDLPLGMQTAGDCKIRECDGLGNALTNVDTNDKPIDTKECTIDECDMMGTPSNTPKMLNDACTQGGGTLCDGLGNCLKAGGANCANAAECITGFCSDSVCCDNTCTNQCMACNLTGSLGICTNVAAGGDDAPLCGGANSCDGMGTCKRDNGQACGMSSECLSGFCTDGVCCDTACTDTCKSCNLADKVGICIFVPNDTVDPTGSTPCNNPNRCDGNGACKGLNSATCTQASDCLSGYCADGFCCNNVCNGLCKACSSALTGGTNGICSNILNGTDPANECPNGSCNGNGSCTGGGGVLPPGSACTSAGQCLSGFCTDGVCCSTACTETCKTCNSSGSCVNVANNTQDPVASTPCTSPYRCDGAGACKALNSVSCTTDSQCFSGYCTDGFCCNTRCSDSLCKSCASTLNAGADGTCGFTKAGIDPRNECNGATPACNGMGMCSP